MSENHPDCVENDCTYLVGCVEAQNEIVVFLYSGSALVVGCYYVKYPILWHAVVCDRSRVKNGKCYPQSQKYEEKCKFLATGAFKNEPTLLAKLVDFTVKR